MVGARLKRGVARAQASAEIEGIGRALEREYPNEDRGYGLGVSASSPIPSGLRLALAGFLGLLLAIVSLVLVIACTNVASVLLARAAARRREIAVRLAIGVGRWRLMRQLLTESLLLFLIGGAAGILLARAMLMLLLSTLPAISVPVNLSLPLDARVVAFSLSVSLVAAVLSGLTPALHASKVDVVSALKDDVQGPTDRLRLRSAFVVGQVAFSILLVVVAGLLLRALNRTASIDFGFDPNGVEVAELELHLGGYSTPTGRQFAAELLNRLRATPGVSDATLGFSPPSLGGGMGLGVTVPGVAPSDGLPFIMASGNVVEPGFFSTMRIPLVAGRDFNEVDREGAELTAIVSESAVRRFWPGKRNDEVLGQSLTTSGGVELVRPNTQPADPASPAARLQKSRTVIGVVGDIGAAGPNQSRRPFVYLPFRQQFSDQVAIIARSTNGRRLGSEIRALVSEMNPRLPVMSTRSLTEQDGPVETQLRVAAAVSGSVGLVGLLLASIGIYGVAAYTVARRTREIGIRMAMGAQRTDVLRMILRQGMALVALGSVIGLVMAAAAGRLLRGLLFGVPPIDPLTFAGAIALFAIIGLTACYIPARRATLVNAIDALRYE